MAVTRPLISVLMPVRDGGDHLPVAVASILGQSLDDLELVLVDDGSRDGACERLAACGDARLKRYRNPGRGIVSALNFAACNATGRYFARMDADDIALPTRLERQVELLAREPGIGIVGAEVEIFAAHGVGEGYRHYQAWINGLRTPAQIGREMFVESPIPHPTAMLSRTLFRVLGGYRETAWAEDYDLWLRAHLQGIAMAKPDGVLLQWRDRERRLSRTDRRYASDRFVAAKAHFLARSRLRHRQAVIWGAATTGATLHDALAREGVTIAAFIDIDPRKIGGRKRGRPVLPAAAAVEVAPALIVGAVGSRGARQVIRTELNGHGMVEGEDYLFAA
jgi:glycosyltransferase involved in cell wall biosynthesis